MDFLSCVMCLTQVGKCEHVVQVCKLSETMCVDGYLSMKVLSVQLLYSVHARVVVDKSYFESQSVASYLPGFQKVGQV